MTYFIVCNGRLLPNDNFTGPLEFTNESDAGEYIADLDGENTLPLFVKPVKDPKAMRALFKVQWGK